ncbi:NAD(P)/FAD-dependent oxidoreductase [Halorarum halophilum]|uniref:NAD(P)/FAD-dependent oxidoreductase n=1 Tax=Halorarum halophilum TaxID=2743090 RepID=A0A7D5KUS0_9EURY|nr:NAD(P)/FAD-dependent oxidoreductase [Halobaculum halophilum]QLG27860.1 NAD(P)/FAD-dependent oxidoreductase [Halobaculum halophilum]
MSDRLSYEVAVVGGGPAGLTTALYTTRLGHRTAVFEREGGRHTAVSHVHNMLGVSEDVSGRQLADHAVEQLWEYGGEYYLDTVNAVERRGDADSSFVVDAARTTVEAERVVLATGFTDVEPPVPDLKRFTGRGLHYCLHCDAYTLGDGPVYVLGHGEGAAHAAMLMLNFTADVDLLLNGNEPEWSAGTERQVRAHPIDRVETPVVDVFARDESADEPWIGGMTFADGSDREYLGGFAMYGREYNTALAESLGCELTDEGAVAVDGSRETSVEGAYAVGDVTHGLNQTVVALGDGARAGIALHRSLRPYPCPPDELDDIEELDVPGSSDDLCSRMRAVRERETHAGLRKPEPDR